MVKNLEITGEITCLGDNAGGISAKQGSFENCINRVNIKAGGNNIGGIAGGENQQSMTISNCKNYGTIEGNNAVSGIIANWGIMTNCQNYGNVKGIQYVGGISGRYGQLENCNNYGEIGEDTSTAVGGIIGNTTNKLITNCINYGKVMGKDNIGGIAGTLNGARIINCINMGNIEATNQGIGGITGYGTNFYALINCCNFGEVKGKNRVGGIIGVLGYIQNNSIYNYTGKIINCYNTGKIEAESYKGGIVGVKAGYGTHSIENCYWKEELNLECGEDISVDGVLEITNSRAYKEQEMKSNTFFTLLNDYVQTYNAGDKAYSNGAELLMWKLDEETGFPMF